MDAVPSVASSLVLHCTKRASTRRASAAAALVMLSALGCRPGVDPEQANSNHGAIRKSLGDGGELSLWASKTQAAIADRVRVEARVVADVGASAQLENYGVALTQGDRSFELRVVASGAEQPVRKDGKKEVVQWYEIEFVLPGEYELPPAQAMFSAKPQVQRSAPAAANDHSPEAPATKRVATEPISLKVTIPSAVLTEADLQTVRRLDPVELPALRRRDAWIAAVLGVAVMALAIAVVVRHRRHREVVERAIPAHEWAYAQIALLRVESLIARGMVQEFFYRVSDIVRGYVERRFLVSAPEMTTEEFLAALVNDLRFDSQNQQMLDQFLTACDLVKFARALPSDAEEEDALVSAARFVDRTRQSADAFSQVQPPPMDAQS